ncbi:MAG: YciI family protein [Actinobacteria bacterium]|nr:YciI family protein [Actinomycetota bacterium]
MQFMALIYGDASRWESFSASEREAVYDTYRAFADDAGKAGVMVGGGELAATRDATTVRVRSDEILVTDGPYAEVKEALGGYFLLECGSMDEAIDYAARIPGAEHGAIEVRPVYVDPNAEGAAS